MSRSMVLCCLFAFVLGDYAISGPGPEPATQSTEELLSRFDNGASRLKAMTSAELSEFLEAQDLKVLDTRVLLVIIASLESCDGYASLEAFKNRCRQNLRHRANMSRVWLENLIRQQSAEPNYGQLYFIDTDMIHALACSVRFNVPQLFAVLISTTANAMTKVLCSLPRAFCEYCGTGRIGLRTSSQPILFLAAEFGNTEALLLLLKMMGIDITAWEKELASSTWNVLPLPTQDGCLLAIKINEVKEAKEIAIARGHVRVAAILEAVLKQLLKEQKNNPESDPVPGPPPPLTRAVAPARVDPRPSRWQRLVNILRGRRQLYPNGCQLLGPDREHSRIMNGYERE